MNLTVVAYLLGLSNTTEMVSHWHSALTADPWGCLNLSKSASKRRKALSGCLGESASKKKIQRGMALMAMANEGGEESQDPHS